MLLTFSLHKPLYHMIQLTSNFATCESLSYVNTFLLLFALAGVTAK